MATPAYIVNAIPGEGDAPGKAIDIVLYGAGSGGGGGPISADDVTVDIDDATITVQQAITALNTGFTNAIIDLQNRVKALEDNQSAGAGAN